MDSLMEIRPGRRIRVAVYDNPTSDTTLFFLHGLGGRGQQWREQIKHFRDKYTLIVPDFLGQGESDKPMSHENLYTFDALSQDIEVLFQKYRHEKNYCVGHSYGGAFAANLALQHQDKIQKCVLITPVNCEPFKQVPVLYGLPVPFIEILRRHLDKSFQKLAFHPSDNPKLLEEEKKHRQKNSMQVIKCLLLGMKNIPCLDFTKLQVPTLIISSEADKLISSAGVSKFYSVIPQARFIMINEAAHMIPLEQGEKVNAALDEFFKE